MLCMLCGARDVSRDVYVVSGGNCSRCCGFTCRWPLSNLESPLGLGAYYLGTDPGCGRGCPLGTFIPSISAFHSRGVFRATRTLCPPPKDPCGIEGAFTHELRRILVPTTVDELLGLPPRES